MRRVADCADEFAFDVLLTAVRINNFMPVRCDGVYRKITAREILFERFSPRNNVWVPVVFIPLLASVRGNFINIVRHFYSDGSELIVVKTVGEKRENLVGFRACGKVPSVCRSTGQHIAYRSADGIGLKPRPVECVND